MRLHHDLGGLVGWLAGRWLVSVGRWSVGRSIRPQDHQDRAVWPGFSLKCAPLQARAYGILGEPQKQRSIRHRHTPVGCLVGRWLAVVRLHHTGQRRVFATPGTGRYYPTAIQGCAYLRIPTRCCVDYDASRRRAPHDRDGGDHHHARYCIWASENSSSRQPSA